MQGLMLRRHRDGWSFAGKVDIIAEETAHTNETGKRMKTESGSLCQPVFKGFRENKDPEASQEDEYGKSIER